MDPAALLNPLINRSTLIVHLIFTRSEKDDTKMSSGVLCAKFRYAQPYSDS